MSTKLATVPCQALRLGAFTLDRCGLTIAGKPSFRDWQQMGVWLEKAEGSLHWWIGDWLNYGEKAYGEKYTEAMEASRFSYQTCRNDKWVAGQVELSLRKDNLSWNHHQLVAAFPPSKQKQLLAKAEREGLSVAALREVICSQTAVEADFAAGPIPEGSYRCIVVDPPWPMEKIERDVRPKQKRELDYPTMSVEKITAKFKEVIRDHAQVEGCHVYLWTTHRFLPDALGIFMQAGVDYQCLLTWVKPTSMTPYSWMYNTEHVLFGHVGSLPLLKLGMKVSFESPAVKHSEKPEIFYERMMAASPEPRLELYQRKKRDGIVGWGNEVNDA
jgi:N6-adenosine-specific RNA methylase IME4